MLREPGGRPSRRCVQPGSRPAFRSDPRSGGDRTSYAARWCLRHRPGGSRWRLLAGQRGEGRLVSAPARRHIEDIPDRPDRIDVTEIFASLAEREHQLGRPVTEVTPTAPQTRGAERPRPLPALLGHARHAGHRRRHGGCPSLSAPRCRPWWPGLPSLSPRRRRGACGRTDTGLAPALPYFPAELRSDAPEARHRADRPVMHTTETSPELWTDARGYCMPVPRCHALLSRWLCGAGLPAGIPPGGHR